MLQAVIKAFPILLLEIDSDGLILSSSSDTPSKFDHQPESILNHHLRDAFPTGIADEFDEALQSLNHGNQVPAINYSLKLRDGEHWFEARFIPSTNGHRTIIIQDITRYKKNEARIQRQLGQMSALQAIDRAIISSTDLNHTLSILLTKLIDNLQIDAAAILLWNPKTKLLEYTTGIGFRTDTLKHTRLKMGSSHAGIAAQERRVVCVDNLGDSKTGFLRSPSFYREEFVSYYGVPLIAKGRIRGVLEIFKRSKINPEPDWFSFLKMLGGQAAIAIDNAMLFDNLERTNDELILAYNATIEGWSRALDMRDHATKGHTKRVTELTLNLARTIGFTEAELIHICRGAILHDIGKMGIPDRILHKPGPLSEKEWKVMRRHPQYAYDLLSQIEYLHPALDIPYRHHEKWDGSGYPCGLREGDIPLSARLFAIVDVFDALTSDRPYRSAWSRKSALKYIQKQAGYYFDPELVPVFLNVIDIQPVEKCEIGLQIFSPS